MNGNGELPTAADFLTQAIQAVVDESAMTYHELAMMEIKKISKGVECLRTSVGQQGLAVAQNAKELGLLRRDVEGLKEDVRGLKDDVSSLKQDVSVLKQDVSDLKEDVTAIRRLVERLAGEK